MTFRLVAAAAAAVAAGVLAPGCANTVCTEGWYSCEEDTEVVRRCVGPAEGGDDDGEYLDVRDCAAEGLACMADVYDGPSGEIRTGGCTTAACRMGSQGIPCVDEGVTTCSLGLVRSCSTTPDADCLAWETVTDCLATGETCGYSGGQAVCMP